MGLRLSVLVVLLLPGAAQAGHCEGAPGLSELGRWAENSAQTASQACEPRAQARAEIGRRLDAAVRLIHPASVDFSLAALFAATYRRFTAGGDLVPTTRAQAETELGLLERGFALHFERVCASRVWQEYDLSDYVPSAQDRSEVCETGLGSTRQILERIRETLCGYPET